MAAAIQKLLEQIVSDAEDPLFLLSDRGRLLALNPAVERLLELPPGDPNTRVQLEARHLRLPLDFPVGEVRQAQRAIVEEGRRRWFSVTFLPVKIGEDSAPFVLGHVSLNLAHASVPSTPESRAEESLERLREMQRARWGIEGVPARSAPMRRLMTQLRWAADGEIPVTFLGEGGTGKQFLARILHVASPRRTEDCVLFDCRSLPPGMQRAQLLDISHIGTDARPLREEPSEPSPLEGPGGTLIVAGVSKLSLDLQELLAKEFDRAGTPRWRLVATDYLSLEETRADGRLCDSLYFLLSGLVIQVPPLRQRREDIPDWCTMMLRRLKEEVPASESAIDLEAMQCLTRYDWPGNLTELEGVLRGACRRAKRRILSTTDFPTRVAQGSSIIAPPAVEAPLPSLDSVLETVERRLIELALRRHKGNKSKAAQELGISRPRLHRRAEQLGFALGNGEAGLDEILDKPFSNDT